jgi:hypothetical protein
MAETRQNNSSNDVLDQILTFRTITTLLEVLQDPSLPGNVKSPTDNHPHVQNSNQPGRGGNHDDRYLTALATLLVRNEEVTATTMHRDTSAQGSSESMIILVCKHEPTHQQPSVDSAEYQVSLANATSGVSGAQSAPLDAQMPVVIHPAGPSSIDPIRPMVYLKETW